LDGSELAERALPQAFALAEKFDSQILLLRIVPVAQDVLAATPALGPYATDFQEARLKQDTEDAQRYLGWVNSRCNTALPIQTAVRQGVPPQAIVAFARESGIDLIVMSTHGRFGLDRIIYGSVAEAIVRGVHIPVLLVPGRTAPQL
jgi:nucleotide-binding universal stress UspA family protein